MHSGVFHTGRLTDLYDPEAANEEQKRQPRHPGDADSGDGIGPEIVDAVVSILDAAGAPFAWERHEGGAAAIARHNDPLPPKLLESIRRTGLALKGPLATPVGGGFRSVNVRLREEFGLYANLRPARTLVPGGRYEDIDIVLVRENLEGLYVGLRALPRRSATIRTRWRSPRASTRAPSAAASPNSPSTTPCRNKRRKVTVVHKANILKALTGVFLETGLEVAKEYEAKLQVDERIVDACAMQLVLDPWQFDVIVTTNLFGDILSDLIAGLVGGLGMAPGANIGTDAAIFEAVHGSAPDIAGKGRRQPPRSPPRRLPDARPRRQERESPTGSAAPSTGLRDDGVRTRDLGGKATTRDFTKAVIGRLSS